MSKETEIKSRDPLQKWTRRPNGRLRIQSISEGPSLTEQQYKEECDINYLMERFNKTGQLPPVSTRTGVYGDFSEIPDYAECLNIVIKADQTFGELPAKIRQKFGNDPQQLIDYLADEKNLDESYELGLRTRPENMVDPVTKAPMVPKKSEGKKKPAEPPASES